MKAAKDKIKKFLSQFFGNHDLQDDEDIFALGFVNSMFAMQLVLFIEKEFEVTIENEDLEFANFRSINSMAALLERKTTVLARE
ncbi:phosphopantetheine-binding protein [Microcoleus sp. Pol7_A1]|uniref:D-alanine--poly(Phosphoribitol) ligase subunit 2 n=1 Tax=Microcoleus asticus IPMA8 TaxID=2563858 RepID=A0ABX2CX16_9CYAN|nr:phosphopantetheine-binding protein [Microcoleus asticus]NQE34944.1 D-alanine--poly(phosphoribitol) ligase subunit 2 [Microcoleus asticus IPMA8]